MSKLLMCSSIVLSIVLLQAESQSCNSNQLTNEDIQYLSTNCTSQSCSRGFNRGITYFFEPLTVTCNGSIVNWTASANIEYGDVQTNPGLIVWRANPQNPGQYIRLEQKIPLTQCNGKHLLLSSQQIYMCELQNQIPVQEGDVLGMEVPMYDSDSDKFNLYFDQISADLPRIYFRRGTTISTFVLSGSRTAVTLPLVSVGIVQADFYADESFSGSAQTVEPTDEEFSTIQPKTNKVTTASRIEDQGLEEKVGFAVGGAVLLVVCSTLIGIQCCVIMRYRKERKLIDLNRRYSEYTTEPYAMIEMSEINMPDSNGSSQNILEQAEHIPISKNPSYMKSSTTSLPNHGDSMYMSADDIALVENPRIVLGEMEESVSEQHGAVERYTTEPLSPHSLNHSTIALISADNEEAYSSIEEMTRPEEIQHSTHEYVNGTRKSTKDINEPIYY